MCAFAGLCGLPLTESGTFLTHSGQFLNQEARLTGAPARLSPNSTGPPPPQAGGASAATLQVAGHQVPVVWKQRRIYNGEEQVDCWFARSAGQLLDGAYEDYLAAHPFDADTVLGLGRPRGPAAAALT